MTSTVADCMDSGLVVFPSLFWVLTGQKKIIFLMQTHAHSNAEIQKQIPWRI
jgi:hypothetical protein